jgi:eukaryotic-like serine/threonine-protein kinase
MKECPRCNREFKDNLFYCSFDGHELVAKPQLDKLIGALLDDKYRIEKKIGQGGMGTVYRATHVHMDSSVSVKVLHPHLSSDATALQRFRREARAAAQIRHPNAVAVTDFGVTRDTGLAYLVMEFLEGVELRDRIKSSPLGYDGILDIVRQICAAVRAAHSKGIIHRDLKPENIWLLEDEDGVERVKVLDFGIAKLRAGSGDGTLTQEGTIVGTPYYMSPEQCAGEELDARSDIYSLGIIIYEMLAGDVPFRAATPMGIVVKHLMESPRRLDELRPGIPVGVQEVVMRALAKKKEDRQESALALALELVLSCIN